MKNKEDQDPGNSSFVSVIRNKIVSYLSPKISKKIKLSSNKKEYPKDNNEYPKEDKEYPKEDNEYPKDDNEYPKDDNEYPKDDNEWDEEEWSNENIKNIKNIKNENLKIKNNIVQNTQEVSDFKDSKSPKHLKSKRYVKSLKKPLKFKKSLIKSLKYKEEYAQSLIKELKIRLKKNKEDFEILEKENNEGKKETLLKESQLKKENDFIKIENKDLKIENQKKSEIIIELIAIISYSGINSKKDFNYK